jgi:3'-phosphoadenosine 5'-phosphosulfate sulfotransferase (PAPS reductase)/FAD synthetase
MPPLAFTDEIKAALAHGKNAVVAIGVSGGKDSCAVALATTTYLRSVGFAGEIVLIHSDLGKTEWLQSITKCEELAAFLGLELLVVRRKAGGMLERWQGRWDNNVERYCNLECVKLILPWSTASMRFCTSELKTAPICAELAKRYKGKMIINVVGIRREESPNRAKAPISKRNTKLQRKTVSQQTDMATDGYDWNPIIEWQIGEVFQIIKDNGLELHEAYTKYSMSRVSCAYCILSNQADLTNATTAEQNHDLYREMVDLEIRSTFSFQSGKWLGDVAPHLLDPVKRLDVEVAKAKADVREEVENAIPKDLLYVKGWPHRAPTAEEAFLLARIRERIGQLLDIPVQYTTPETVIARYEELLKLKSLKNGPRTLREV